MRFFLADFEIGIHAVVLLFADQRAHLGFALERRAELDLLRLLGHRLDELLVDRLLHQDAAAGRADFALIDEDAEERAVDGGFEIGVGKENVRRLAAEFERDALHRVGGLLDDDLAHGGAAGECDLVDVGMLHERGAAGLAETGNNVDHARRQAAVGEMFRKFERGERRLLRGLKHAGASGGQRRRQFPRRHQQRIVPRNNLSGNADRLFERKAHRIVGNGIHIADNFGREPAVIFEAGGDIVEVVLGFDDRLAGVAAFEFGERGQIGANFFGQAEQHAAALLRGCRRPRAFFESGLGSGDGAVHVVGRGVRNLGDYFFGRRIVDRESFRGLARDPFAVDEHLISLYFGLDSAGHALTSGG